MITESYERRATDDRHVVRHGFVLLAVPSYTVASSGAPPRIAVTAS
jgi:hypothetical protein